jgi:hypothetical protein
MDLLTEKADDDLPVDLPALKRLLAERAESTHRFHRVKDALLLATLAARGRALHGAPRPDPMPMGPASPAFTHEL